MNPFEFCQSFIGKVISKRNWNPHPIQPQDIKGGGRPGHIGLRQIRVAHNDDFGKWEETG